MVCINKTQKHGPNTQRKITLEKVSYYENKFKTTPSTNNYALSHVMKETFGKTSKNLKILGLQLYVTFSFASIVFTNKSKFQKQLPLAKKHFIFLKRHPRPNLKVFEYQI